MVLTMKKRILYFLRLTLRIKIRDCEVCGKLYRANEDYEREGDIDASYHESIDGYACPGCWGELQDLQTKRMKIRKFLEDGKCQKCGTYGDWLKSEINRFECRACGHEVSHKQIYQGKIVLW